MSPGKSASKQVRTKIVTTSDDFVILSTAKMTLPALYRSEPPRRGIEGFFFGSQVSGTALIFFCCRSAVGNYGEMEDNIIRISASRGCGLSGGACKWPASWRCDGMGRLIVGVARRRKIAVRARELRATRDATIREMKTASSCHHHHQHQQQQHQQQQHWRQRRRRPRAS